MESITIDNNNIIDNKIKITLAKFSISMIIEDNKVVYFEKDFLELKDYYKLVRNLSFPVKNINTKYLYNDFYFKYNKKYIVFNKVKRYDTSEFNKKYDINLLYFSKNDKDVTKMIIYKISELKQKSKYIFYVTNEIIENYLTKTNSNTSKFVYNLSNGFIYINDTINNISFKNKIFNLNNNNISYLYFNSLRNFSNIYQFLSTLNIKNYHFTSIPIDKIPNFKLYDKTKLYYIKLSNNKIYIYEIEIIFCYENKFILKLYKLDLDVI